VEVTALIRATHPWAYRSGEWAKLTGTAALPGFPEGDRPCYLVTFSDGDADWWPVHDSTEPVSFGYEFLMTGPET
jgi:hypothetical protein